MDKEIITKSKAQIKNKWLETKEDELDMALNIIDDLEQQVKKQKEVLANAIAFYENNKQECVIGRTEEGKLRKDYYLPARLSKTLIDKLKEVSE